jgi:hypothetical protein
MPRSDAAARCAQLDSETAIENGNSPNVWTKGKIVAAKQEMNAAPVDSAVDDVDQGRKRGCDHLTAAGFTRARLCRAAAKRCPALGERHNPRVMTSHMRHRSATTTSSIMQLSEARAR